MPVRPQPMIAVADVARARAFYTAALGAGAAHGGDEYEQLRCDGTLVLQLHALAEVHHHGGLADPAQPLGNGVVLWFAVDDLDAAAARARQAPGGELVADVHVNPNAGQREIWLRDPDGYLVVLAGA